MYLLLDLHIKSFDTISVIAIAVIAQYKTVAVTTNALMANTIAVIASAVKARVVEACGSARGLKLFETGCFNMFSRNILHVVFGRHGCTCIILGHEEEMSL